MKYLIQLYWVDPDGNEHNQKIEATQAHVYIDSDDQQELFVVAADIEEEEGEGLFGYIDVHMMAPADVDYSGEQPKFTYTWSAEESTN